MCQLRPKRSRFRTTRELVPPLNAQSQVMLRREAAAVLRCQPSVAQRPEFSATSPCVQTALLTTALKRQRVPFQQFSASKHCSQEEHNVWQSGGRRSGASAARRLHQRFGRGSCLWQFRIGARSAGCVLLRAARVDLQINLEAWAGVTREPVIPQLCALSQGRCRVGLERCCRSRRHWYAAQEWQADQRACQPLRRWCRPQLPHPGCWVHRLRRHACWTPRAAACRSHGSQTLQRCAPRTPQPRRLWRSTSNRSRVGTGASGEL
jgi:hypothetical protein